MRFTTLLAVSYGVATSATSIPGFVQQLPGYDSVSELASSRELYLIEVAAGDTRWVTDEEKWQLRRQGTKFMDITDTPDLGKTNALRVAQKSAFPDKLAHQEVLKPALQSLSKKEMRHNLEKFTSFHTRYYKSEYGVKSSNWLFGQVKSIVETTKASHAVSVQQFPHPWGQSSIIATIPGQSNNTVVIGAHQDSINLFFPSLLAAPGADDDGSGTVTILEAFRVLLGSEAVRNGNATNTVEFHWYSAEEGGLLGSQAIFQAYEKEGREVKAMLQQDMTGYVQGTLDEGKEESVGVVTDFVDEDLTEFIKKVITEYCDIPYVLTKCGYACSDHASASKAGYPSAFVIESEFSLSDKKIHTTEDKLEYLSFDHMLQHARLTLGLAYELAFAEL